MCDGTKGNISSHPGIYGSTAAAITAYLEDNLVACDVAAAAAVGDARETEFTALAREMQGRILFKLARFAEARHSSQAVVKLAPDHLPLAAQLALAGAGGRAPLLPSRGALHTQPHAAADAATAAYPLPWDTTAGAFPAFGSAHTPLWVSEVSTTLSDYTSGEIQ
jgi:hypothetical protein